MKKSIIIFLVLQCFINTFGQTTIEFSQLESRYLASRMMLLADSGFFQESIKIALNNQERIKKDSILYSPELELAFRTTDLKTQLIGPNFSTNYYLEGEMPRKKTQFITNNEILILYKYNEIRLVNPLSGTIIKKIEFPDSIRDFSLSTDNNYLYVATETPVDSRFETYFFRCDLRTEQILFVGKSNRYTRGLSHPESGNAREILYATIYNRKLEVYDLDENLIFRDEDTSDWGVDSKVTFAKNYPNLLGLPQSGKVLFWDKEKFNGKNVSHKEDYMFKTDACNLSPDGKKVLYSIADKAYIWDSQTDESTFLGQHDSIWLEGWYFPAWVRGFQTDVLMDIAISSGEYKYEQQLDHSMYCTLDYDVSGEFIISSATDSTVRIWDAKKRTELFKIPIKSHPSHVTLFPSKHLFVNRYGKVDIYNLQNLNPFSKEPVIKLINSPSLSDKRTTASFCFNSTGDKCIVQDRFCNIFLYDLNTMELLLQTETPKDSYLPHELTDDLKTLILRDKHYSALKKYFILCSLDLATNKVINKDTVECNIPEIPEILIKDQNTIQIYRDNNKIFSHTFDYSIEAATFIPNTNKIIYLYKEKNVGIFEFPTVDELINKWRRYFPNE